ncbi:hypothetical protein ACIRQY_35525 [Streptomyces sp. NPDC101490]|uniref:hypothetical protein n=1 Tax=Streptomyces sp. NPDC101490 TaxID=3366143 RepID=UPI003808CEEF
MTEPRGWPWAVNWEAIRPGARLVHGVDAGGDDGRVGGLLVVVKADQVARVLHPAGET